MRYFIPLLVLTACAAPEKEVAPAAVVDPGVERMPALTFPMLAWETVGATLESTLRLEQPFDGDTVELTFQYQGPGDMEVPEPLVATVGELTTGVVVQFTAGPGTQGDGQIEVVYASQTQGDVVVGSLPVVHTTDLIEDIQFHHADSMMDPDQSEAAFVVVVDLAPVEGQHEDAIRQERVVDLMASIEEQVSFDPDVQVTSSVASSSLIGLPIIRRSAGEQQIFLITVDQRTSAPMRRPFVKIEARLGGDREVEYLPLRF